MSAIAAPLCGLSAERSAAHGYSSHQAESGTSIKVMPYVWERLGQRNHTKRRQASEVL
jgi:hypothetical protein